MINFITQVFTRRLKSAKYPRIFAPTLDAAVFAKSARNSAERMGLRARFVFIFVLALAPLVSFAARPAAAQSTPGPIAPRLGQSSRDGGWLTATSAAVAGCPVQFQYIPLPCADDR